MSTQPCDEVISILVSALTTRASGSDILDASWLNPEGTVDIEDNVRFETVNEFKDTAFLGGDYRFEDEP